MSCRFRSPSVRSIRARQSSKSGPSWLLPPTAFAIRLSAQKDPHMRDISFRYASPLSPTTIVDTGCVCRASKRRSSSSLFCLHLGLVPKTHVYTLRSSALLFPPLDAVPRRMLTFPVRGAHPALRGGAGADRYACETDTFFAASSSSRVCHPLRASRLISVRVFSGAPPPRRA